MKYLLLYITCLLGGIILLGNRMLIPAMAATPPPSYTPPSLIVKEKINVFGHATYRMVDRQYGVVCYADTPRSGDSVKWSCASMVKGY